MDYEAGNRTRTENLLITDQLHCQLCYASITTKLRSPGFEPGISGLWTQRLAICPARIGITWPGIVMRNIKRPVYLKNIEKAHDGIRTRIPSLEGWCPSHWTTYALYRTKAPGGTRTLNLSLTRRLLLPIELQEQMWLISCPDIISHEFTWPFTLSFTVRLYP